MIDRTPYLELWEELSRDKAMIFLAGPRQAGKTTLARQIMTRYTNTVYYNYDLPETKKLIVEKPAFFKEADRKDESPPLIVFDEIHKYRHWKNYLKGTYDGYHGDYRFLVLGSGRLNVYQKGGDSLAGRYFLFYLWPLTLSELAGKRWAHEAFFRNPLRVAETSEALLFEIWDRLKAVGGFPEPYANGSDTFYRRWVNTHQATIVREDIRNATEIKNLDSLELLLSLLPARVGSPLSMDSLARDLQVAAKTVKLWLSTLEGFFLGFPLSPWSKRVNRAITKEKKWYLFNGPSVTEAPARFENLVAVELFRAVTHWNDRGLGGFSLHYVRNKEKEEVDFLLVRDGRPFLLVEAKTAEDQPSKSLRKFQGLFNVPAVQLVDKPGIYRALSGEKENILVISAPRWLAGLP